MPPQLVSANFFTHEHRIRGKINTNDRRLTDVLNEELHSSIELTDVEVSRVIEPQKVIHRYPSAVLMKQAIVFVIAEGERANGVEDRIFKYVEKKPYEVVLTLPPYEVSGVLHLRGTGSLQALLVRETGRFTPMTEARVVFTLFPKIEFSGDVAIVNRGLLEVIGEWERGEE